MKIYLDDKLVPNEKGAVSVTSHTYTLWKKLGCVLVLGLLTGCGRGKAAATVTSIRIQPRIETHDNEQLIYVDWKNTGTTPIYYVAAMLTVYDAADKVIRQVDNTEIYDSTKPVPAGTICSPFEVNPYYFVPQNNQQKATRATAKILRIGKGPVTHFVVPLN